jgi:DNA polymerase-3 subunit epsilon
VIGALARLLGLGRPDDALPPRALRWVVVDCESSGLDPDRDSLLSIGAVAVREGRVAHADAFGAVLRQAQASEVPNILVHGIGAQAQLGGRDPAAALDEFARFVAGAPLVAFHAAFDRALLGRAMAARDSRDSRDARDARGAAWKPRWLDLAQLAPALYPQRAKSCKSLNDWLAAFAIGHPARHDAMADAYATAQLMLILLAEAERQGVAAAGGLFAVAREHRWLG